MTMILRDENKMKDESKIESLYNKASNDLKIINELKSKSDIFTRDEFELYLPSKVHMGDLPYDTRKDLTYIENSVEILLHKFNMDEYLDNEGYLLEDYSIQNGGEIRKQQAMLTKVITDIVSYATPQADLLDSKTKTLVKDTFDSNKELMDKVAKIGEQKGSYVPNREALEDYSTSLLESIYGDDNVDVVGIATYDFDGLSRPCLVNLCLDQDTNTCSVYFSFEKTPGEFLVYDAYSNEVNERNLVEEKEDR